VHIVGFSAGLQTTRLKQDRDQCQQMCGAWNDDASVPVQLDTTADSHTRRHLALRQSTAASETQ
jgi:hypothetical protein